MNHFIFETINDIKNLPNIDDVRAILRYTNRVDFEILHTYETEFDYILPQSVRDTILDLIMDANEKLRDETGEKWYFDHFYSFKDFKHSFEGEIVVEPKTGLS